VMGRRRLRCIPHGIPFGENVDGSGEEPADGLALLAGPRPHATSFTTHDRNTDEIGGLAKRICGPELVLCSEPPAR